MGVYIYSVRTKNIDIEIDGNVEKVYALGFASRSNIGLAGEEGYAATAITRAHNTWDKRDDKPKFVFLAGGKRDNKPEDFAPVFEWDGRVVDYDTPKFDGAKRTVGYLRSRKVGRKTVWTVEPAIYTASVGTDKTTGFKCFHIRTSETFFSGAEAVEWAKANMLTGENARFSCSEAGAKPALERLSAPTSAQIESVVDTLVQGMNTLADPVQEATAEAIAPKGLVGLYRCFEDKVWYELTLHGLIEGGNLPRVRGLYISMDHERIVFQGGPHGAHSVCRGTYTPLSRVINHWEGYRKIAQAKVAKVAVV